MSDVSAIIIHIGKFSLQIQQSILVWLGICAFFSFFFYFTTLLKHFQCHFL